VPPALHLRYQGSAAALSQVVVARFRELKRLQAEAARRSSAAAGAAPRAAQAGAAAAGAVVRQAAPVVRPEGVAAGQRPGGVVAANAANGGEVSPGDAGIDQLLAEVASRLAAAGVALAA
jgi:hypothetical protein